ncbi:type II toxin-antitoxin system ParD family antitoxin [Ancrocorticia populi]|uniref:Type II toxin-antitoxin system ParD family antitoxin n=1 Tax=Ancrocorticia populi TaxID=2175228 RepID=A0A2V1K6T0_9ACTO|nr:type II toxin-antitoxin system ParD family antitoxin [Ancrocorticia populi]MDN6487122.1 type II toxin-antitoxin system ParD family antitoxin [Ancrocorticia sp.]PWF25897.1 type II toxin-antitoxin system ParD family antitoxin [Ancrocorticia populi]
MPTRNVVLTSHQQEFIERLVTAGQYQNASEVMREGLRLVEEKEQEKRAKLAVLRQAAEIGWQDIESGRFTDVSAKELGSFIASIGEEVSRSIESD